MGNEFKDISIKNSTSYFFDGIINIKNLDANKINIDKKSYKNIPIYYIGYVTLKDLRYVKTNSVNPLYIIINKINGSIEESNENKCLRVVPTDENKDTLKKYEELCTKIRVLIRSKTYMVLMKKIWKSNLIQMIMYL